MRSFVVGAALLALAIPQVGSSADIEDDEARSYIPPPPMMALFILQSCGNVPEAKELSAALLEHAERCGIDADRRLAFADKLIIAANWSELRRAADPTALCPRPEWAGAGVKLARQWVDHFRSEKPDPDLASQFTCDDIKALAR